MGLPLTSRERILRTVRGEATDRVPIAPTIPWNIWDEIEARPPQGWQGEDNYQRVLALTRKYCDTTAPSHVLGGLFSRAQLHCPMKYSEVIRKEQQGDRTIITRVLHTPKGDLRTVTATDVGVHTVWTVEPLVKDVNDVEKILSVPYDWERPDMTAFQREIALVGERAPIEIHLSTPMICVSHILSFETFLSWTLAERPTIERLIRTAFDRIYEKLEYILQRGAGPIFWMGGSEQATPPMMSPRLYDELVVKYDGPLIDLIHKHGQYVHVHCHGKIAAIFDRLLQMGVDMLDPVEPPPDGDIEFAAAKRRAAGRMTLMGNIEFRHLEFATPDEIDDLVRHALCDGPKDHLVLFPTATLISRMSDRYCENAIQFIESGLRYGPFSHDVAIRRQT